MLRRKLQAIARSGNASYTKIHHEHPSGSKSSSAQTIAAEILDKIFPYLSKEDLESCTLVCSWWCTRSSHLLFHKLTIPSKSKISFKRSGFHTFYAVARGSPRLAYAVRELYLDGCLDFLCLRAMVQELTSLETLQLKKAYFSPLSGKRPTLPAATGRKIQNLRLLDVGIHPKSSSSGPSVWNTVAMFSAIGELRISGVYQSSSENVGILRSAASNGLRTRISALCFQGDLVSLLQAVLQHNVNFLHMKHLAVRSTSILKQGQLLAKFISKLGRNITSFYYDGSVGGHDMDGENLSHKVSRETRIWEDIRAALSTCSCLKKVRSHCRMTLCDGMISPMSTSWNDHAKALLRATHSLKDVRLELSCHEILTPRSSTGLAWGFINSLNWSLVEPVGEDGGVMSDIGERKVTLIVKTLDLQDRNGLYWLQHSGVNLDLKSTRDYEDLIRSKISPRYQEMLTFGG